MMCRVSDGSSHFSSLPSFVPGRGLAQAKIGGFHGNFAATSQRPSGSPSDRAESESVAKRVQAFEPNARPMMEPDALGEQLSSSVPQQLAKTVRTMFQSQVISRVCLVGACATATVLYAGAAYSQPREMRACKATYEDAKGKEEAGQLLEARDGYAQCAKTACGRFLVQECTTRHARLDTDIPSVVPVVTDESGAPRTDVSVTVDGESFASKLEGHSLPVNPGVHEFAFSTDDQVFAKEKVMILQGDRNRRIAASLSAKRSRKAAAASTSSEERSVAKKEEERSKEEERAEAPASEDNVPSGSKRIPAMSYVLGGVGALGVGGFVLLSSWARSDNNNLVNGCSPNCSTAARDHVKQRYLMADVSLGVGIAGLGSAILVYALSHGSKERPPEEQAYAIGVQPTPAGAVASVAGSF
jgi:hypothetical protein